MDVAGGNRTPSSWTWIAPLSCILAGAAVLPFDLRIAAMFQGDRSSLMTGFWEISEVFGHGVGTVFILVAAMTLGSLPWRDLPWLVAGSLGAGMLANALKLCVSRTRPRDFDLINGSVWGTFIRNDHDLKSMQSFPSSHTATAVGLAIVLSAVFPRGRYLFAGLAILVGAQRIATNAHFPSDVCIGAAVGFVVGVCCASFLPTAPELPQPSSQSA